MATKKSLPQDSPSRRRNSRKLPPGVVVKNGKWYVRVRYRDGGSKRHAAWRECAKNATNAKEVRAQLLEELNTRGPVSLKSAQKTFEELADYYKDNYLIEAQYADGRKTSGRRNTTNPRYQLKQLRNSIGDKTRLRNIDFEFLRSLRLQMFADPVVIEKWQPAERDVRGKTITVKRGIKVKQTSQRSITDVNRKMELLRHMLTVARRKSWILVNPFKDAEEPLITRADEKKRRRIMSFEEEDALLTHATVDRDHLRIVIIGLVDSLIRWSEFIRLRVGDLDMDVSRVNAQQLNTKTLRARAAPMSRRFAIELKAWIEKKKLNFGDRLFPFDSVKTAWRTLKRNAGVTDLRIKDLRRTGATRLVRAGYPIAEVSLILGHTTIKMTYEYIGIDEDTTSRAVDILDAMHARRVQLELIN